MMIKKFNQYIKESNNFSVDPDDAYYEIIDTLDSYNIKYDVIDGTKGEYSDDSEPAWIFVVNFKGNEYKIQLFYYEDVIDGNEWLRNIFIDIYDPIEDDNIRISYKSDLIDFFKSKIDVGSAFKKMNEKNNLPTDIIQVVNDIKNYFNKIKLEYTTRDTISDSTNKRFYFRGKEGELNWFRVEEYSDFSYDPQKDIVMIITDEEDYFQDYSKLKKWIQEKVLGKDRVNKSFVKMNELLDYNQFKLLNESINVDKLKGKLPIPSQWSEDVQETDKIITKILDIFKIDYTRHVNPNALININNGGNNVDYSSIEIPHVENQDISTLDVYYDLGTDRENLGSSVYISSDFHGYSGDEISDPYDLIDFLDEHGFINYSNWINKVNEGMDLEKLKSKLPESFPQDFEQLNNLIIKYLNLAKIEFDESVNDLPSTLLTLQRKVWCKTFFIKEEDRTEISIYFIDGEFKIDSKYYIGAQLVNKLLKTPYDLLDFIFNISGSVDINKFNVKTFKKFNESLSEEQIMKNKSTTFDEKEDQIIRLRLKELEEYNKMKARMENELKDLDNDIDYITINKMIGGNPFLKQYVMLLSKKRELDLIDQQIEQKEELIESTKNEFEGSNNDQRRDLMDQVKGYESEIKELQQKRSEYSVIDQMLQKWDSQILRIRRDLKQGKSVLTSTLSWLR